MAFNGERLKSIREEKNISVADLARRLGIGEQAVYKYESGIVTNVPLSRVELMGKVLGIEPGYLMEWTDKTIDDIIRTHPDLHPIRRIKPVPILGAIACGTPIWAEENFEGYVGLDPEHMDGDFALYCKGDSMVDADIFNGDLVLLRKTPEVENGKIAAVLIGDEATLKKVYIEDDTLLLQPCNSAYTPLIYKKVDLEQGEVSILGECVGVYHAM